MASLTFLPLLASPLSLFATASATAAMAASLILRRGFRATRLLNMPTVVTGVAP